VSRNAPVANINIDSFKDTLRVVLSPWRVRLPAQPPSIFTSLNSEML
jgi:hypothetical protein